MEEPKLYPNNTHSDRDFPILRQLECPRMKLAKNEIQSPKASQLNLVGSQTGRLSPTQARANDLTLILEKSAPHEKDSAYHFDLSKVQTRLNLLPTFHYPTSKITSIEFCW